MKSLIQTIGLCLITVPLLSQQVTVEAEVSMLALGDSYTIGESVEEKDRWPNQFIRQLRILGVSAQLPYYVATTGWTTRNLLNGIQTKLPEDRTYNLVSILIGVNNQYQGMDIAAYEPDLRKIINEALGLVNQDSSRIFILSIPDYAYTPFGRENSSISQEIDAYNAIKRRVADEYGIAFINITEISRMGLDNPSLVAADGLHPSKEQYALWVQAILPRLKLKKNLSGEKQQTGGKAFVQLYPNPAASRVQMDAGGNIDRIRIFSPLGRVVLDLGIDSLPASIDVSHLGSGAYTLCAYRTGRPEIHCRSLLIQNP